jgi:hypothetical protein
MFCTDAKDAKVKLKATLETVRSSYVLKITKYVLVNKSCLSEHFIQPPTNHLNLYLHIRSPLAACAR